MPPLQKHAGRHGTFDGTDFPEPAPPDALPSAVSSLEDRELRLLLVALLSEWRTRTARGFHA
jgi:hypothetical protein